ncbi:hypothetical protein HYS72_01120 [Candidatus Pacearchaeota archaeon]|nr:hypothetical protein [Candidatus Pacearchaeota archaeon]
MARYLEELFPNGQSDFRDSKGYFRVPKPVGGPLTVIKKIGERKGESTILNQIIDNHYAGYEINAYIKEFKERIEENKILFAVQFYKI